MFIDLENVLNQFTYYDKIIISDLIKIEANVLKAVRNWIDYY